MSSINTKKTQKMISKKCTVVLSAEEGESGVCSIPDKSAVGGVSGECSVPEKKEELVFSQCVEEEASSDCSVLDLPSRSSTTGNEGSRFFRGQDETMSGSESDTLTAVTDESSTLTERSRFLRARKRTAPEAQESASDTSTSKGTKTTKAKRGRSKPASTGHYIGLAEARKQLNAAKKEQLQLDLEERVLASERRARAARAKYGYGTSLVPHYESLTIPELEKLMEEDVSEVLEIGAKSSNLKGTLQKGLRMRVQNMKSIVDELAKRSISEETQRLQATNNRLQAQIDSLTKELSAIKASLGGRLKNQGSKSPTWMEVAEQPLALTPLTAVPTDSHQNYLEKVRDMILQERTFTRALIAGMEDRLLPEKRLRPPLAADRKKEVASVDKPAIEEVFKAPQPVKPSKRKSQSKKSDASILTPATPSALQAGPSKAVATRALPVLELQEEDLLLPSTTLANNGWTKVVKKVKGRDKKSVSTVDQSLAKKATKESKATKDKSVLSRTQKRKPQASNKAKAKKLVPPKSSAVVVTLTTDAIERGVTYESVLQKVRQEVAPDASALGVGFVRCRPTRDGARKFEFPGANSGPSADTFAEKLRLAISDVAKVSRPTKCLTLEISDLDDTITKEEIIAKISVHGGCPADNIKAGNIRPGRLGMRTVRVRCPIAAAKAVVSAGKFLIGFSSASVKVLEEQPLRCFKCFGIGHTRTLCPSSVERTELCYRCGKAGHKSAECKDKPNCVVCEESGRPANHVMRGRNCNPPPKKGKVKVATQPAAAINEAGPVVSVNGAMSE